MAAILFNRALAIDHLKTFSLVYAKNGCNRVYMSLISKSNNYQNDEFLLSSRL